MTDISAWIRAGLEKSGKTQVGLADALEIHPSGMAKILSGKRRVRIEELPIIAKYLDQPVPAGQLSAGDVTRVQELEEENKRLKALLAEYLIKDALTKK